MVAMTATGIGLAGAQIVCQSGDAATARDWNLPAIKVEVDWTNTGNWVDESAYCRGVSVSRGRSGINDVFAAGTAQVTLRNLEGRFTPFNAASPLYPNVVGSRPIRIHASYRGVVYAEYQGFLAEVRQIAAAPQAAVVFSCVDAFEQFRLSSKAAATQTSQRTDQVIQAILTAAGWTGSVALDTGRTLATYIQPSGNTLQGLQHAALQDVVGQFYMGASGAATFRAAGARAATPIWHVYTSVEAETLEIRQADLVASVDVLYNTKVGSGVVASSTTNLTATFTVGAAVPALSAITLTANDHADGSGLNLSQQVWVRSISVSGAVATLSIYNSLPYTAYVQSISGNGIGSLTGPTLSVAAAGPLVSSQSLAITFDYVTDQTVISAWAQQAGAALRGQHPRPVVEIAGRTPELIHSLLGADLGTRIVVQDQSVTPGATRWQLPLLLPSYDPGSGAWLTQLADQFFIENIQLDLQPRQVPRATWTLYDAAQGAL